MEEQVAPETAAAHTAFAPGLDLVAAAAELGVPLDDDRARRLGRLAGLLEEWNERRYLTGIRDRGEIERKHLLDSLAPAAWGWRASGGAAPARLLDVGSGAGFPALPLAISFPEVRVTALESSRKRCEFIQLAADEVGVDLLVVRGRAEAEGQRPVLRERMDLVIARAVAYLPALAELCLPFVRIGGRFVAMKSEGLREELAHGAAAIEVMGGRLLEPLPYELPDVPGPRWLVPVEKVAPTPPGYPREPGTPTRAPVLRVDEPMPRAAPKRRRRSDWE